MARSSCRLNCSTLVTTVSSTLAQAEDLDLGAGGDHTLFDLAGGDRPPPLDGVNTLDRHEERPVGRPLRVRDVPVQSVEQLRDAPARLGVAGTLQCRPGVATDERGALTVEAILRQQVTGLHLHEVDQLGIIHEIDLVDEDDEIGDADLAGQEDVLPGLRHRAVGRRDQQHRPVHLGRPGDHVLDIIGVAGAVDVGVVPPLRLVLDVAGDDGDGLGGVPDVAALADVLVGLRAGEPLGRLDRQDGGGQGGLAVVDVTDGADVDVNLLHGTISRSPRSGDRSGDGPFVPIVSDLFTTPSGTRDSGATIPGAGRTHGVAVSSWRPIFRVWCIVAEDDRFSPSGPMPCEGDTGLGVGFQTAGSS